MVDGKEAKRQHAVGRSLLGGKATQFQTAFFMGGPRVASLSGGSIAYVWCGFKVDANGRDTLSVFARMFDSLGNPITAQFTVNQHLGPHQKRPDVAALSNGGFIVVWESFMQDSSGYGVYFRRYDSLGFPIDDAEEQANVESASTQFQATVVGIPTGGWVIAWNSFDQDGDDGGIFARVFTADGLGGDEFQVNDFVKGNQHLPRVASLPSGRWLVTWTSVNQDSEAKSAASIYAKIYEPGQEIKGTKEIKINSGTVGRNFQSESIGFVTHDEKDAGFVVVWIDESASKTRPDIGLARILSEPFNGHPTGTVFGRFRVNYVAKFTQWAPTIAQTGTGKFIAVNWDEGTRGLKRQFLTRNFKYASRTQTVAALVDDKGKPRKTHFTMIPHVTRSTFNGGIATAWQDIYTDKKTTAMRLRIAVDLETFKLTAPLTLIGTDGPDTLIGDAEDDVFYGGLGDDVFDGKQKGSASDKVVYRGERSTYTVTKKSASLYTVSSATDGTDTLKGIELLQFADVQMRINTPPSTVDDVLVVDAGKGAGKTDILANDDDVEDEKPRFPGRVTITAQPRVGKAALKDGVLTVTFAAGKARGFATVGYTVTDDAGLTSSAKVHVRFPCDGVAGTDDGEVLETGGLVDAAACGNKFTLTGKKGADTFTILRRAGGADTITDFKVGEADLLELNGFATLKTAAQVLLDARQAGDDTKLTLEGTHTVLLKGVTATDLSAASFAGALGKRPLLINTMDNIWFQTKASVAYDLATLPAFKARSFQQGNLIFRADKINQGLVVWEAFQQNYPDPVQMRDSAYVIHNIPVPDVDPKTCVCDRRAQPIKSSKGDVPIVCPKGLVLITTKAECETAGKELGLVNRPGLEFKRTIVRGRIVSSRVTVQPKALVSDPRDARGVQGSGSQSVGPVGCYVKNYVADTERLFFATDKNGKKDAAFDPCCQRSSFVDPLRLLAVVGDFPRGAAKEFPNGVMLVCKDPNKKTKENKGQDGDGGGVFAQFIGADGRRSGSEFLVNSGITKGTQASPSVIAHPSVGAFLITWTHYITQPVIKRTFTAAVGVRYDGIMEGSVTESMTLAQLVWHDTGTDTVCIDEPVGHTERKQCTQANQAKTAGGSLPKPGNQLSLSGRFRGARIEGGTTVAVQVTHPDPGYSHFFYYATTRFCCALFTRTVSKGRATKHLRIDDTSGVVVPSRSNNRQEQPGVYVLLRATYCTFIVKWGANRLCVRARLLSRGGLAGAHAHKVKKTTHFLLFYCCRPRGDAVSLWDEANKLGHEHSVAGARTTLGRTQVVGYHHFKLEKPSSAHKFFRPHSLVRVGTRGSKRVDCAVRTHGVFDGASLKKLSVRVLDVLTQKLSDRIDVTPPTAKGPNGLSAMYTTTDFCIVALPPGTVPASKTVDALAQFVVVHTTSEAYRAPGHITPCPSNTDSKTEPCGENLYMSTYVRKPGTSGKTFDLANKAVLLQGEPGFWRHTRVPNLFTGSVGISAVSMGPVIVDGKKLTLVVVTWLQQLTFAPALTVMVQAFSAPDGNPAGERIVLTSFDLRDGDTPRRPLIKVAPSTSHNKQTNHVQAAVYVTWTQAKVLGVKSPNTDIFGMEVTLRDLVSSPPVCQPDSVEIEEDTTLEIALTTLRDNDKSFQSPGGGSGGLSLKRMFFDSHELKVNSGKADLGKDNWGVLAPNVKSTTVKGLRGEFFTSDTRLFENIVPDECFDDDGKPRDGKPLDTLREWDSVSAKRAGVGRFSTGDQAQGHHGYLFEVRDTFGFPKTIDFANAVPNTLKPQPDVQVVIKTLDLKGVYIPTTTLDMVGQRHFGLDPGLKVNVNHGHFQLNDRSKPMPGLPRYFFHNYWGRVTGKIAIPHDDVYQFSVRADTAATLFIDGKEIMTSKYYGAMTDHTFDRSNGNNHFGEDSRRTPRYSANRIAVKGNGLVTLKKGDHDIKLHYYKADLYISFDNLLVKPPQPYQRGPVPGSAGSFEVRVPCRTFAMQCVMCNGGRVDFCNGGHVDCVRLCAAKPGRDGLAVHRVTESR